MSLVFLLRYFNTLGDLCVDGDHNRFFSFPFLCFTFLFYILCFLLLVSYFVCVAFSFSFLFFFVNESNFRFSFRLKDGRVANEDIRGGRSWIWVKAEEWRLVKKVKISAWNKVWDMVGRLEYRKAISNKKSRLEWSTVAAEKMKQRHWTGISNKIANDKNWRLEVSQLQRNCRKGKQLMSQG